MRRRESIEENLRFLLIAVRKQVARAHAYWVEPNPALHRSASAADDYVDHLKHTIHDQSFAQARATLSGGPREMARLKAYDVVALNLERIADFAERVIGQAERMGADSPVRKRYDFEAFFTEAERGLALTETAVFGSDVQAALSVCRAEQALDRLYSDLLTQTERDLTHADAADIQPILRAIFIGHYLERTGDSLLNIGESILSAHLGERVRLGRLRTLEDSLRDGPSGNWQGLQLQVVADSKSGARVGSLRSADSDDAPPSVIVKEGKLAKLEGERANVARWNALLPGVAPRVLSFRDAGSDGVVLFEYLSGHTLEALLLEGSRSQVEAALDAALRVLGTLWRKTRSSPSAEPRFISQAAARLPDVFAAHPEFCVEPRSIGEVSIVPIADLLSALSPIDGRLSAPCSVLIHGDCNLDNILYDSTSAAVHFVDLHRSCMGDYVQDLSVLLVSCLRLQRLGTAVRERGLAVMDRVVAFGAAQADSLEDESYEQRLTLGVARSLLTSTRFVLDRTLSRGLLLRARYLLERLVEAEHRGELGAFRFPVQVLRD